MLRTHTTNYKGYGSNSQRPLIYGLRNYRTKPISNDYERKTKTIGNMRTIDMNTRATKITKNQQEALLRKWKQYNQDMTYLQFRRTAMPMVCDPAIVVKWCNMWLAIEPDGYVHS
jgi:hypothetical protein